MVVYSLQALDQCEKTLSQLGLTRINAADAAGAAQVVVMNFYELILMLICGRLMLI